MSDKMVNVILSDKHSVNLYDAENGNFLQNVYITSGEIIGSPVVSGNICTITYVEGNRTMISTYNMPSMNIRSTMYP